MRIKTKRLKGLTLILVSTILIVLAFFEIAWAEGPAGRKSQKQRFRWIVAKRLTVENQATFNGPVTVNGAVTFASDLTVEGDTDLQGQVANSTGDLDLRDNITVSGNIDTAGGVVVTGTTELRSTLDIQGAVSDSNSDLDITDNVTVTGDVDVTGGIVVTGTSDLRGNVSDGAGTFTIADDVLVDGQVDAIQLTVQGAVGDQGSSLIVVEDSAGTDMVTIGPHGATVISGTLDVGGNTVISGATDFHGPLSNSLTDLMLNDNVNVSAAFHVDGNQYFTGTTLAFGVIVPQDYIENDAGDLDLRDTISVSGGANINGNVAITGTISNNAGDLDLRDNITVAGDVDLTGNLHVTGTSEFEGNIFDGDGTLTLADDVLIDGQADAIQLTVQGETGAQTNNLFVVEDSAGTDVFSVGHQGATFISGTLHTQGYLYDNNSDIDFRGNITVAGDVDLTGNLHVTGTSEFEGNVFDGDGTFTIADDTLMDGQTDVVQLTVQGVTGIQTADLVVAEDSGGTDMFSVGSTGNTMISGTLDLRGNASDGAGTLTIADDVLIDGQADAVQLTIQGSSSGAQTRNLLILEDSAGTPMVTVGQHGATVVSGTLDVGDNLIVTGTTQLRSTLDVMGAVSDSDTDVMLNDDLNVSGDTDLVGGLIVTGTTQLRSTLDVMGAVSDSDTDVMLNDDVNVSGDLDVVGNMVITGTVSNPFGDVNVTDNISVTNDLEVGENVKITGTLTLEDIAFSGPITFGSDAVTGDREQISHGLNAVPASVVVTPITDTVPISCCIAVSATDTSVFTMSIHVNCSNRIGIYWFAGK